MVKYSHLEYGKFFFKFCRSNLLWYFCKVAYPKIWLSHGNRQVQREIRETTEECKKDVIERKDWKRGKIQWIEPVWKDESLKEGGKGLTPLD